MLAPTAGTVPIGRTSAAVGSGVQLVAAIGPVLVPPNVRTVIVGWASKPEVASRPVTVIVTVFPPLTGSGAAMAVKVGGDVSMMKVPLPVLGLPAWSDTLATM